MLNLERILEISEKMNVTIDTTTEGVHYILNSKGEKIKFEIDMLKSDNTILVESKELKVEVSDRIYKPLNNHSSSYYVNPINIEKSNVIAA